jgi:ABC-2 type transport system permease protein
MNQSQNRVIRSAVRISAFLFKEMLEIARQPMLLITLVVGPFLILFFFGIGFRNEPQALRTLFVVDDVNGPIAQEVERYGKTLGKQLIFEGITSDEETARADLNSGKVDLVVKVPSAPYETIKNSEQAVFDLYHRELNPIQAGYVDTFGRVYVDEVNRRILQYITKSGQVDALQIEDALTVVRGNIENLKEILNECADTLAETSNNDQCDTETLDQLTRELDRNVDEVQIKLGETASTSDAAQRWLRGDTTGNLHKDLQPTLNRAIRNTNKLENFDSLEKEADAYLEQVHNLTKLETDLDLIRERLAEFAGIKPWVLVSPFRSDVINQAAVITTVTDYYAPAVIAMLLQHLTVTFAALSLVRERLLGSVELFTVSPISALETLLGKYFSYLLFGGVLALILFGLLVFGMNVPLLGSVGGVAIIILGVIFTSLGIGFVISLFSSTDTQAVQYSMLILLTSVFFSGFILELHTLWEPVQTISWLLPVTYGIVSLRDIMLRGNPLNWTLMAGLFGIGFAMFVLAWWLLNRSMKKA